MVRAIMMTPDQIAGFVEAARADPILWENLKDREKGQFNVDGSAKIPSLAMLVRELVERKYGARHGYDVGDLIMELRYHTRRELGLPV